nr:MAG TPA: hypothetical protein [Bacteriophage sp.]
MVFQNFIILNRYITKNKSIMNIFGIYVKNIH